MRTTLSLVAVALLSLPASAGDFAERGTLYVEGAFAFTSTTGEITDGNVTLDVPAQSRLLLASTFGAFVVDGLFIGGALTIDRSSFEDDDGESSATTAIILGVTPRYYIGLNHEGSIFIGLGGLLGYQTQWLDPAEPSGFVLGANAGLVVALGAERGAVLDVGPFVQQEWLSEDDTELSTTTFGFKVGLGMYF